MFAKLNFPEYQVRNLISGSLDYGLDPLPYHEHLEVASG